MQTLPKEDYPALDKQERRSVAVLRQRLEYLQMKLETGDHSDAARPFLQDEHKALVWLLSEVDATYRSDGADEQAVRALDSLCSQVVGKCDGEAVHVDADKILLENANPRVRQAYQRAIARAPWWVAA